jgi:phosphoribosylanthranilate isomerase
MQVKICGVRSVAAAHACVHAGADLVGINLVPNARRSVNAATARRLVDALDGIPAVGIFRDQPTLEIERIAAHIGLSWVQLHGRESREECAALRQQFRVIKALVADDDPTEYMEVADILLVDGRRPGSGQPWDLSTWQRPDFFPVFLAGGLTPDNVAAAIESVHPDGVDVASGVEHDGRQDLDLIRAFVVRAKGAVP